MTGFVPEEGDELLRRATDALRGAPIADAPAVDPTIALLEEVALLEDAEHELEFTTPSQRRSRMLPFARYSFAASLVFLCGVIAWTLSGDTAAVALTDVAEALGRIRTATCSTSYEKEGEPAITGKSYFSSGVGYRTESSRGMVMVFGEKEQKLLTMVPKRKVAFVASMKNAPQDGSRDGFSGRWLEDVRDRIRQSAEGGEGRLEELGLEEIDGKETVGYLVRVDRRELRVWADVQSGLPVRVEQTVGFGSDWARLVMSGFKYNTPLDRKLFRVRPPAGYTVQRQEMDASDPREEDLVALFRKFCEEHGANQFPRELSAGYIQNVLQRSAEQRLEEKFGKWKRDDAARKKAMRSKEFQEVMQTAQLVGRGMGFLQDALPPETEWHYAGRGARLGEPDRPVFWYRKPGDEEFRVIYADLTTGAAGWWAMRWFPEPSESSAE